MDRLSLSLSTMGVGMLVVFSGLVILIACISIMTIFTGRQKKAAKQDFFRQRRAQERVKEKCRQRRKSLTGKL